MFLLTGETNKKGVGVLDTDDMTVEYISANKVVKLLYNGTRFGNLSYNPDYFVEYVETNSPPKFEIIIENTGLGRPEDTYAIAGGMQFDKDFFVINEKYKFACRYKRTSIIGVKFDIPHKGVYHRIETQDFVGFFYNGVPYLSAMNLSRNKISHIGYDVDSGRLELLCTDGLRKEKIIFTSKGIRYKNRSLGRYQEIPSNIKGLDLRAFKRYMLME